MIADTDGVGTTNSDEDHKTAIDELTTDEAVDKSVDAMISTLTAPS